MRLGELGEFGLIARIADAVGMAQRPVVVGIGDDAAVLEALSDSYLLVTTDACLEGQHFRRQWLTAEQIGRRAAGAALSDIAAMGGKALAVFVSAGLPPTEEAAFAEQIICAIHETATEYGATLAGGDTFASAQGICLDVVVIGQVQQPWLRSTAQPGDVLLVTGTLGEAAAALHLLEAGSVSHADGLPPALRRRFVRPIPRFAVARCLQQLSQTPCAIDISDGLVQDAAHIAEASGVALTIQASRLPIAEACREVAVEVDADLLRWALTSGEEYELLLAVPRSLVEPACALVKPEGVRLTEIGFVTAGEGVVVVDAEEKAIKLDSTGWNHFISR